MRLAMTCKRIPRGMLPLIMKVKNFEIEKTAADLKDFKPLSSWPQLQIRIEIVVHNLKIQAG
jgi:hypothetical protein